MAIASTTSKAAFAIICLRLFAGCTNERRVAEPPQVEHGGSSVASASAAPLHAAPSATGTSTSVPASPQGNAAHETGTSQNSTRDTTLPDNPDIWIARKNRYKPAGDEFPQIIQDSDEGAIHTIQTLYRAVAASSPKFGDQPFVFNSDGAQVIITSSRGSTALVVGESGVKIGSRAHSGKSVDVLFRTFVRLLADLGSRFPSKGLKGKRWRNRGYLDNILLEFCFSPLVVALESGSNGPGHPERLYMLDLIWEKESVLWKENAVTEREGAR